MKQNLPMMYATVLLSLLSFHPTICSAGGIEISQEIETRSDDQSVKRTITVKDASGAAITGAIVKNDASGKAAITDINGSAMVAANDGEKISVDFMGYKTHTLTASVADTYLVILETDELLVDEVVVVGYGVQKKVNLTGSVSQVEMDKVLGDRPVTSVTNALQGSIPGLQITGNSAQPGKNQSINIRGTTSINGGGPLILIDNVPGDINMINPEDIESISVLKDAASTAIYGARGAFGVMLITTKKAKNDTKLSINYNNNFGFSKSLNFTESASLENFLNSYLDAEFGGKKYWTGQDIPTWLSLAEEYRTNPEAMLQKGHFIGSEKDTYVLNGTDADVAANRYYFFENNQQKKMLDNFGFQQIHNVSASGGSKNIAYRIAMGYMSNNGVLKTNKDSESRTNVSSYVKADITNWFSTSLDLKYAKSKVKEPYTSNMWSANENPYQPQGIIPFDGEEYPAATCEHILKYSPIINRTANDTRIYSRSSIHPLKGLEGIFEYTYNGVDNDMTQNNYNTEICIPISLSPGKIPQTQYWNNKSNSAYNALNAYVSYQFDINKSHNFKIMAGFAQEQRTYKALNVTRKDLINPSLPSISGSTGETISTDDYKEYIIRGGYFRVNYDYKSKYLLEVNGRYDGSSKFPRSNRYGFFPSVSAGYRLAEEKFMDWSNKWLNEFKLRGSWGSVGNQAVGEYDYMPMMGSYRANWLLDGTQQTTLNPPSMSSQNYTWEKVETLDLGLDISALQNRLSASVGWYQRDTKGMLTKGADFPGVVGTESPKQNAADLRTKGWELSASWRETRGEWNYSAGFNLYDSKSVITKFANETGLLNDWREGEVLGEIWGYQTDGYYSIDDFKQTTDGVKGWQDNVWNLNEGVTSIKGTNVRPGDIKFKNLNDWGSSKNMIDDGENTESNPGDRKIIGNTTFRFQYGITASVGWKGFDLSVLLQGVGKRDIYTNDPLRFSFGQGTFSTIYDSQLDYWKPISTDVKDPNYMRPQKENPEFYRIYGSCGNVGSNQRTQTGYLLDASYLRIKNVTLSYNIPKRIINHAKIAAAKIFFSGENLHTFQNLPKGYDAERSGWGYPFYRTFSIGLSLTL